MLRKIFSAEPCLQMSSVQLNINKAELKDARWFSLDEVIEALQVKMMPPKMADGTMPVWVPPRFAIAHHLIQEWVQEQKMELEIK